MWNIRSHARRFPVHTGTLTPSIAHPNRFLNHLKLFSAGFLTFRGWKIKNCTVSGDKTNDFECAPGSWPALSVKPYRACQLSQRESPWHDGKVSGQTAKLAVSPEPLPLGEVSPQVTERARPLPENAAAAVLRPHPSTHCVCSKASTQPQLFRFRQKLPLRGSWQTRRV